jgi:hypothetical protein
MQRQAFLLYVLTKSTWQSWNCLSTLPTVWISSTQVLQVQAPNWRRTLDGSSLVGFLNTTDANIMILLEQKNGAAFDAQLDFWGIFWLQAAKAKIRKGP